MLSFSPPSNAGEALMPFLVIVGLQWLFQMNSDGTGYLAQRSMACPTDREARIAGLVFTWLQIFLRSRSGWRSPLACWCSIRSAPRK